MENKREIKLSPPFLKLVSLSHSPSSTFIYFHKKILRLKKKLLSNSRLPIEHQQNKLIELKP